MQKGKIKLLRITTIPLSLKFLLSGQPKYFSSLGFEVLLASADGKEVTEVTSREEVDHKVIPFTRKITPIQDLYCLFSLVRLILKERPLIVHTHTPKAGLIGMLAAYLTRVPCRLHTVAGLPLLEEVGLKRKLLNMLERLAYRCATRVLPNSKGLHSIIQTQLGYNSDKVSVLANGSSNGIDTNYFKRSPELLGAAFELRKNLGIDPEHKILVFIGRIVTHKGINELIKAFENLKVKSTVHLLLIGSQERELDALLPETLNSISSNQHIHELGWLEDVRIPLISSDLLVFPSYREGFPNVPLQAGAMCIPSIVTDINGCNEIVEDMKTGLLIPPKDSGALKKAIEKLLGSSDLRKEMSQNSRDRIVDRFDRKLVWQALLNEYETKLNVS